jgi:hypothetical protein
MRQDGIVEKVLAAEATGGLPGPDRAQLLDLIDVDREKEHACVST